jgi:hypothetical protein
LHLITTDGGRSPDGSWHTMAEWDAVIALCLRQRASDPRGPVATPEQAQEVHAFIRSRIAAKHGQAVATSCGYSTAAP